MLEDNTCHFGVNNFFSDLGLKSKHAPDTQLFFPADVHQTSKVVEAVFWQSGLRFIYTTRSKADRCRPKRMIKDGFHSSLWTWRFDRFCTCLLSLALEGQFGIIWHHIQMLRTERMLLSRFIACRFSTVPIRFFLCCCGCQQPQRADWLAPSFPWPTYDAQGFVCFLIIDIDLFGLSADDRGLYKPCLVSPDCFRFLRSWTTLEGLFSGTAMNFSWERMIWFGEIRHVTATSSLTAMRCIDL